MSATIKRGSRYQHLLRTFDPCQKVRRGQILWGLSSLRRGACISCQGLVYHDWAEDAMAQARQRISPLGSCARLHLHAQMELDCLLISNMIIVRYSKKYGLNERGPATYDFKISIKE